jgi:sugar/nucleoside kinase (ribokinase family)
MKNIKKSLVVGIGSALVDILIEESDDFLKTAGAQKGGMTLVENPDFINKLLAQTNQKPCIVPGGSACNTIVGIACLGGKARFIGKRGKDELGSLLENTLHKCNVETCLYVSNSETGRVLSIITPDAQRSMFTFLGASSQTKPEEITKEQFKDALIVHIEGYLLFNKDLFISALKTAKSAGAKISLDLASYTVVESTKTLLGQYIKDYVDILIANEDEARAFTGHSDEKEALSILSQYSEIAVVKMGKRGSLIYNNGEIIPVGIIGDGCALDTTGAGDLWAAGFLFGLANGYSIKESAYIGAACGYEVCQVIGAQIPEQGWKRIKNICGI